MVAGNLVLLVTAAVDVIAVSLVQPLMQTVARVSTPLDCDFVSAASTAVAKRIFMGVLAACR
jgi:hypothetical protein